MPAKKSVPTQMRSVRLALRQLERTLDDLASTLAAPGATGVKIRRKLQITPARRAALKLQGQYMGHMRNLRPAQKAKVKKIRAMKGIRAAIAAARRLTS